MENEEKKVDLLAIGNLDPEQEAEPADWYAKYPKPDIWDRFKSHFVDAMLVYIPAMLVYYLVLPAFLPIEPFNPAYVLVRLFLAVYLNVGQLITWIFLWRTNGRTPGKKMFKQRVVRLDGESLTLKDAFIREFLIKGVCNLCSFGLMNIASIIVAYIRPNSRALHDVAANTLSIDVSGPGEEEPRVEFN